jgi:hypothetical protein
MIYILNIVFVTLFYFFAVHFPIYAGFLAVVNTVLFFSYNDIEVKQFDDLAYIIFGWFFAPIGVFL